MKLNQTGDSERRFKGVEQLYGRSALDAFKKSHIVVIGIGGVGSWVVEALARNAIGKITLIDMDVVAESNINRQLPAQSNTIGRNKIDVMAERIVQINPYCETVLIDDFISADNIEQLIDVNSDYVIDCIDNSRVKAALVYWCKRNKVKIITLGGAGGQTDPSKIRISDLSKTEHDPLLSKTRKLLRQDYGFSKNTRRRFSVPCVYSTEHLKYADDAQKQSANLSCAGGLGSSVMVTGSFGFLATSHVLNSIVKKPLNNRRHSG